MGGRPLNYALDGQENEAPSLKIESFIERANCVLFALFSSLALFFLFVWMKGEMALQEDPHRNGEGIALMSAAFAICLIAGTLFGLTYLGFHRRWRLRWALQLLPFLGAAYLCALGLGMAV